MVQQSTKSPGLQDMGNVTANKVTKMNKYLERLQAWSKSQLSWHLNQARAFVVIPGFAAAWESLAFRSTRASFPTCLAGLPEEKALKEWL